MTNMTDVQETLTNQSEAASSAAPTTAEPALEARESALPAETQAPETDAKQAAEPSTAGDKDANKKATLLDVVKSALRENKPDSDSSTEGDAKVAAKTDNAEAKPVMDEGQKPKDDQAKQADDVPFHNHPRWKELKSERDSLKPRAEQFDKVVQFMQTNQLSTQEMAEGMQVMALMKQNPAEAYKALKGYADKLAMFAGEALPEDLKGKVENSYVDQDTAKELAALRAQQQFQAQRQQQMEELRQQEQIRLAQEAEVRVANERALAVDTWAETQKARDPQWAEKFPMVESRVKALLLETPIRTPDEAVKLAQRALADVEGWMARAGNKSVPIRQPASALSSANARPAPKNLLEVVQASLNN